MRELGKHVSQFFRITKALNQRALQAAGRLTCAVLRQINPALIGVQGKLQTEPLRANGLCSNFARIDPNRYRNGTANISHGVRSRGPNNTRPQSDYPNEVDLMLLGSGAFGTLLFSVSAFAIEFWKFPIEALREPIWLSAGMIIVGGVGALGRFIWAAFKDKPYR